MCELMFCSLTEGGLGIINNMEMLELGMAIRKEKPGN